MKLDYEEVARYYSNGMLQEMCEKLGVPLIEVIGLLLKEAGSVKEKGLMIESLLHKIDDLEEKVSYLEHEINFLER